MVINSSSSRYFYVKTENPTAVTVAIAQGWGIGSNDSFSLSPIKVMIVGNGAIAAAKDSRGFPKITTESTDWYVIDVPVEGDGQQAQDLVSVLLSCVEVDLAAEDRRMSGEIPGDVEADIIGADHRLALTQLPAREQLALAIKIASDVHVGQFDKGGKPYILHPLHLMQQLLFDMQLATIAVLHDVIEDSDGVVTLDSLRKSGFSTRVCDALALLTHQPGQAYIDDYIRSICTNYDAVRVKRKDLEHNSNITRIKGVSEADLSRIEKYHRAFVLLGEAKNTFL